MRAAERGNLFAYRHATEGFEGGGALEGLRLGDQPGPKKILPQIPQNDQRVKLKILVCILG